MRVVPPPSVFFVNLTERCQLACAHCITRAPEATASGRARHLAPEVLAALTPHLAHARYVGFTHSGEPLLSPMLNPFLAALRAQRGGAPTTVHLISNGMALTERRFDELCAAGVTSWSLSLDGLSAESNDALRVGAKVDVLLPRLRALAARKPPAVRLGVSCTITRSNLHELGDLVRFAADAKLDWLKLEEVFPLNARAQHEATFPRAQLDATLATARALADTLALPLVDHTGTHEVWKCVPNVMTPEAARFSVADDFANSRDINPCLAPFEVVCIEPDGAVKPQDFHQPAVGTLLEHDLLRLWTSGPFVARRQFSVSRRRCGDRPTCAGAVVTGGRVA